MLVLRALRQQQRPEKPREIIPKAPSAENVKKVVSEILWQFL